MATTAAERSSSINLPEPPILGHWIAGQLVEDLHSTESADLFDPAVGQVAARVALADSDGVGLAVRAALDALPAWSATPVSSRVSIMREFREQIVEQREQLIATICREHGKVYADAAGELERGLEMVDLACTAPMMLKGEFSDEVAAGLDTYSLRQPVGVCAGITPFNFPAMVPLWMFPISIVCGNTFVLKPSERDPSASLTLAQIAKSAGLPDGVLNVVQGAKPAVDAILAHPDVGAVSFVGSTPIARYVYQQAAAHGKRVQALGGAKNHMVVLPDADIEQVADAIVSAAFGSTGQRCMAISVGVSVGPVAEPLIEAVRSRVERLRTGAHDQVDADLGPLISGQARDRVLEYIDSGEQDGAVLVADGRRCQVPGHTQGFFVGPTVFDHVSPQMDIYKDEIFGPVLVHLRVDDVQEALDLIAASEYGNGAAVFTRSGGAARRFLRAVTAGMVGVNVPIPVPVASHSFGGWGQSLFGDLHMYGPDGFRFNTRGKVVTARWPASDAVSGVDLAFPTDRP